MLSDPRDYKLELSRIENPEADCAPAGRPFLSVLFACCGAYQRVYRSRDGRSYDARCPRCGKPARFVVGEEGTTARAFVVS